MSERPKFEINEEEMAKSRSKTRRLEELMPEIERVLASGVPRKTVLSNLNERGFDLTMQSFETMLKRLRKRSAKSKTSAENTTRLPDRRNDTSSHSKLVHEQFKGNPDRPRTVQHDLSKVPDW